MNNKLKRFIEVTTKLEKWTNRIDKKRLAISTVIAIVIYGAAFLFAYLYFGA